MHQSDKTTGISYELNPEFLMNKSYNIPTCTLKEGFSTDRYIDKYLEKDYYRKNEYDPKALTRSSTFIPEA
jgi:hypothetical protein